MRQKYEYYGSPPHITSDAAPRGPTFVDDLPDSWMFFNDADPDTTTC